MERRTIVITGASDGVGAAAARELADQGEEVVLIGRSPQKTAALAAELDAPHHVADFSSLAQVRRLAADLDAAYPRIDVLANNAGGIMGSKRQVSEDGNELTFQVNHLAGFLLTTLLMDKLIASRASVIQTSSIAARMAGRVDLDNLQLTHHYSSQRAYGASKLENILFTKELHRRYHDQGLSAAAFHPGAVGSNFARETDNPMRAFYTVGFLRRLIMISPERGAAQLIWLADARPGPAWRSGEYYVKRRPGRTAAQADDAEAARRLWEASERLVGLS